MCLLRERVHGSKGKFNRDICCGGEAREDLEWSEPQGEREPLLQRQVFDLARKVEARGARISIIAYGSFLKRSSCGRACRPARRMALRFE